MERVIFRTVQNDTFEANILGQTKTTANLNAISLEIQFVAISLARSLNKTQRSLKRFVSPDGPFFV